MGLPRGLEAKPFDQPQVVVALAKFFERFGQLFDGLEVAHPEKLLLEGAEEAFDRARTKAGDDSRPRKRISRWKSSLMNCEPWS